LDRLDIGHQTRDVDVAIHEEVQQKEGQREAEPKLSIEIKRKEKKRDSKVYYCLVGAGPS
jgi:hypothetical protein